MAAIIQHALPIPGDDYDAALFRQAFRQIEQSLTRSAIALRKRVKVDSATYTVARNDEIIGVIYTTTAGVAVTLPAATAQFFTTGDKVRTLTITDEGNNASANNITVTTVGADVIIGGDTINTDGGFVSYYSNGVDSWIRC